MAQPTFEQRCEARRNLIELERIDALGRWQHEARDACRRHRRWAINPFIGFTPRDAAVDDLARRLRHDDDVRRAVSPAIDWAALAEAVIASMPRTRSPLETMADAAWRAAGWSVSLISSGRGRPRADASDVRISDPAPAAHKIAA